MPREALTAGNTVAIYAAATPEGYQAFVSHVKAECQLWAGNKPQANLWREGGNWVLKRLPYTDTRGRRMSFPTQTFGTAAEAMHALRASEAPSGASADAGQSPTPKARKSVIQST